MAIIPAEVRDEVTELLAAADVVIAAADADEYSTTREAEAAINQVRALIAAVLPRVSAAWGVAGQPLHASLRELAARLLDLHTAVASATETIDEETDRTTSFIELAVRHYGDFSRFTELAVLNPDISHPGVIPPGTTVTRYVR